MDEVQGMTRDDIIKLAREAGLVRTGDRWVEPARWGVTELVHFAALVAAHEREMCAKVCEDTDFGSDADFYRPDFAAAIRARGETK